MSDDVDIQIQAARTMLLNLATSSSDPSLFSYHFIRELQQQFLNAVSTSASSSSSSYTSTSRTPSPEPGPPGDFTTLPTTANSELQPDDPLEAAFAIAALGSHLRAEDSSGASVAQQDSVPSPRSKDATAREAATTGKNPADNEIQEPARALRTNRTDREKSGRHRHRERRLRKTAGADRMTELLAASMLHFGASIQGDPGHITFLEDGAGTRRALLPQTTSVWNDPKQIYQTAWDQEFPNSNASSSSVSLASATNRPTLESANHDGLEGLNIEALPPILLPPILTFEEVKQVVPGPSRPGTAPWALTGDAGTPSLAGQPTESTAKLRAAQGHELGERELPSAQMLPTGPADPIAVPIPPPPHWSPSTAGPYGPPHSFVSLPSDLISPASCRSRSRVERLLKPSLPYRAPPGYPYPPPPSQDFGYHDGMSACHPRHRMNPTARLTQGSSCFFFFFFARPSSTLSSPSVCLGITA